MAEKRINGEDAQNKTWQKFNDSKNAVTCSKHIFFFLNCKHERTVIEVPVTKFTKTLSVLEGSVKKKQGNDLIQFGT